MVIMKPPPPQKKCTVKSVCLFHAVLVRHYNITCSKLLRERVRRRPASDVKHDRKFTRSFHDHYYAISLNDGLFVVHDVRERRADPVCSHTVRFGKPESRPEPSW